MVSRTQIKEKLPHGYGKVIAARAGVSPRFVSKFLNDDSVKSVKVQTATLAVLEEIKKKENEFNNRLLAALS